MFCLVARSGYHGIKSSSPSATPGGQHRNFHTNLKIVSNFLVASPATRLPLNHALFLSEIMEIVMFIALSHYRVSNNFLMQEHPKGDSSLPKNIIKV